MKKLIFLFVVLFVFTGCDPFDKSSTNLITPSSFQEEPDAKTQWAVYKDESFYTEYGINGDAHINPQNKYDMYTGKGVKVAIIDDGFDTTHPELERRIYRSFDCSSGTCIIGNVKHTSSSEYHGTAVSGIIAANGDKKGIRGIAPMVNLILIKMPLHLTSHSIISMFQVAIDSGADIINCSWGTDDVDQSVEDYLGYISKNERDGKGVVVVFASGNDNQSMANDESAVESVIGVGATDHNNLRTSYSNYGKELDIVAPGGGNVAGDYGISTIDPVGSAGATDNDYNLFNELNNGSEVSFIGTSASAPILTGAIALMFEANPNLTFLQIKELLQSTSDKIGQNVPYINDSVVLSTTTPTFNGSLGSSNYSNFQLKILTNSGVTVGTYSVNIDGSNWNYTVSSAMPEGNYSARLESNGTVFATDVSFEINTSKATKINSLRNDYYGYGKLNLHNLINGAIALK